ncbi:MAG: hypothetical protein IJ996_02670 [Clostridia bacterium]|nr:hypothetical protein [Clostridia bacterium]
MGKTMKPKRDKVPRITEEEYVRYIATLKNETAQDGTPVLQNEKLDKNPLNDNET